MKQGLTQNWRQFSILVVINAFVGGMVGLERTVVPTLGESRFGLEDHTILLSFIGSFGLAKAISNYAAGRLTKKLTRKNILQLGWLFAIPVPLLLIYSTAWNGIVLANVFLGINQGLAWSTTVLMKIDLVGNKNRGFALGLNEFSGYLAVALFSFGASWIAAEFGPHPYPFYLSIALVVAGLVLSFFFVHDTTALASLESDSVKHQVHKYVFLNTSVFNKNLSTVTIAGFVNNLNDAMIWGILPIWMLSQNFSMIEIGIVASIYPAVWGVAQIVTGKLGDIFCIKDVISYGMIFQAIAIFFMPFANSLPWLAILSGLLGIGTALVYPNFLVSIAENTNVHDRAESLGVFRFWRDLGYVAGAFLVGITANMFGFLFAIELVALLTLLAGMVATFRMSCPSSIKSFTCFRG